jgi:hypothetical protein
MPLQNQDPNQPDRTLPEFQGIRRITSEQVSSLKELFKNELVGDDKVRNKGYFIGKNLLMEMILEFDGANGILISFGADDTLLGDEAVGEIHLQFEAANLNGDDDDYSINVLSSKNKYGTGIPGVEPPDPILPAIKPQG